MRVLEAMRKDMVIVDENMSIADSSKLMREKSEGCALILKQGRPVGIITERDITWKVAGDGLDPKGVKVGEIMSKPLITVDPDADLVEAARLMCKHKIRRLAVAKNGILYGIVTAIDIARNLEGYVDEEVRKILRAAFFFPLPR